MSSQKLDDLDISECVYRHQ